VNKNNLTLVTRHDIGVEKLEDLRKRKFGSRGRHPGLNTWLYLKQSGLDPDTDQVEIVTEKREESPTGIKKVKGKSLLEMVASGDCDGCFVNEPRREQARRRGLKLIDIPTQPMVFFMTLSTSSKLVQKRPDVARRVIKSVLEGIAYFKIHREETIKILQAHHLKEGALDRDGAEKLYDDLAPRLEPRLYPGLDAIYNVYLEALKQDESNGDAKRVHPRALWDFHLLRELDDQGFINNLYKGHMHLLEGFGG
jgi:ABC-type nitrate/sulfonate/bicarbonate transport system substrate-binding protein